MQLRRLELAGFKTFVDRTELEFHPGITAIVGPNGSGKSNIFDGIRWALGETNARLLRGLRMEDVIFSGSAHRRPLGMATVALTLDNSAGGLPVEFAEVTVSRTVTRGGEGAYAINGVDCRLRDVQMLFLGTGLGGRSYALIGQGEVDAVLRATPVERRHWLEEAAGLARHKRQRIEAERRLDHAQAYLDRLGDLLDELGRQQQALAVQAEAAARHRAYTTELRDLEVALFADEARRLLGATRRLAAQLAVEREQAAASERRAAEAAADVALVEAHLANATAAWEQGQQALLDGAEALRARAAEVQALDAQAEGLRGQLTHVEAELARLDEERAALAGDANALTAHLADAVRRHQAAADGLAVAEADLEQAAAVAREAEAHLGRQRDEAMEVVRTLAQTRSDLAALRGRAEVVAQSVEAAAQRVGALGQAAARLASEREAAARAAEAARAVLRAAEDALVAATSQVEARRADLTSARERVHTVELEVHRLRSRLVALEEAAAQFVGFEDGAREVLRAARTHPERFPGLRGALADLIVVPQEFQGAVAAALDRRLHCLVVERAAQLEHVVRFLTEEARAGGMLVAMDALPRGDPAARTSAPAVVARAAEVVGTDPDLRPVVDALIGDAVIVDDLPTAWELAAAGHPGRIVTRGGIVLAPDGVVSVAGPTNGEAAPLGRGQAIAGLQRALADAEARHLEAESAQADAARALAAAEAALRAARADREAAASACGEHEQHVGRLAAEAARLADEEAAASQDAQAATDSLRRLEAEIAQSQADLEYLEGALRDLEAQVATAEDEVRRTAGARDDMAEAVAARRLALVQAEGVVASLRERLSDRTAALSDLEARRAEVAATAHRLEADLAAIRARRDEAASACDRDAAAHTATRDEVERLAAERVRLREAMAGRQAEHAAAVEAARSAQAAVHKTELRAAQAEAELHAAAARLQEECGIGLEDAAARRLEGSREDARRRVEELRGALRDLGAVNLRAIEEHAALTERLEALRAHVDDLQRAQAALRAAIKHINAALRVRFRQTFDQVNQEFGRLFVELFEGGEGSLELVEDEAGGEPGLEVIAQLPGKKRRPLVALSGGERVLVALALIFAMLRVHPSPFCIFDEVEAALDDVNTKRFTTLLRELARQTQVIIITHNKGTMAAADVLYGVTMQEPGLSSIVSVRLVPPSPNGEQPPDDGSRARAGAPAAQTAALPAE
ncbi:MAG: chromosome segregation protein SMC [Armatimonadota bacterium]|nr:chromosome segregation protein SMC [Armatimonadota bacterium]